MDRGGAAPRRPGPRPDRPALRAQQPPLHRAAPRPGLGANGYKKDEDAILITDFAFQVARLTTETSALSGAAGQLEKFETSLTHELGHAIQWQQADLLAGFTGLTEGGQHMFGSRMYRSFEELEARLTELTGSREGAEAALRQVDEGGAQMFVKDRFFVGKADSQGRMTFMEGDAANVPHGGDRGDMWTYSRSLKTEMWADQVALAVNAPERLYYELVEYPTREAQRKAAQVAAKAEELAGLEADGASAESVAAARTELEALRAEDVFAQRYRTNMRTQFDYMRTNLFHLTPAKIDTLASQIAASAPAGFEAQFAELAATFRTRAEHASTEWQVQNLRLTRERELRQRLGLPAPEVVEQKGGGLLDRLRFWR